MILLILYAEKLCAVMSLYEKLSLMLAAATLAVNIIFLTTR
ncbi:hypothetical protein HMPREF1148_1547 [Selenomonas sp. FOBRC6]|nr:hypothetical protein HMPREF1148_1547 [Selenomonas sp. FOBRC6]